MRYPRLNLLTGQDRRLRAGHPWVFSNELQMDAAAKALPPGEIVCLFTADGRPLALAQFNPHSLIAARVVTRNKDAVIDAQASSSAASPGPCGCARSCTISPTTASSMPRPTACRAWWSTASATFWSAS